MSSRWDSLGRLIMRLSLGGMMIFHGISKIIHGIGWMGPLLASSGLPEFVKYGVFVGEVVAPIALLLGYRTRLAALLIAFDMVMALTLVHRHIIFSLGPGGGWAVELPMLYLLGSVALFFLGGGKYSVGNTQKIWG